MQGRPQLLPVPELDTSHARLQRWHVDSCSCSRAILEVPSSPLALCLLLTQESFFKKLGAALQSIPPAVATLKILPLLAHALEFGGTRGPASTRLHVSLHPLVPGHLMLCTSPPTLLPALALNPGAPHVHLGCRIRQ